jgi:hypothetical protein
MHQGEPMQADQFEFYFGYCSSLFHTNTLLVHLFVTDFSTVKVH